MRTHYTLVALSLLALPLSACDKAPADPPKPMVRPVPIESGSAQQGAPGTSVPPADSVIAQPSETKPDPAAGRSNSTMSRPQESSAMPLPGQNNDHSAPLTPAKRASSP